MTKTSAAPRMITPSRSSRVAAGAGAVSVHQPRRRRLGRGLGGGVEGEQDRGVAGGNAAGLGEDFEAGPVAGIVALGRRDRRRARRGPAASSARGAAERVGGHQRGRGLAEGAGLHLLAERGDPALAVERDVDGDPAAADRRALLDARLRALEPAQMRDRRGEAQDVAAVEGAGHGRL